MIKNASNLSKLLSATLVLFFAQDVGASASAAAAAEEDIGLFVNDVGGANGDTILHFEKSADRDKTFYSHIFTPHEKDLLGKDYYSASELSMMTPAELAELDERQRLAREKSD